MLRPGGILLDLRPYAAPWPLEIINKNQRWPVGWLDGSLKKEDDVACEAALERALSLEWFHPAGSTDFFEFPYYLSSPADLSRAIACHWADALTPPSPALTRELLRLWSKADNRAEVLLRRPLRLTAYLRQE